MKPIDPHTEPFRAIFEGLNDLATSIYARTGKKGLLRVKIDHEIGLSLGLLPGQVGQVHTAAGPVEIESDAPHCCPFCGFARPGQDYFQVCRECATALEATP